MSWRLAVASALLALVLMAQERTNPGVAPANSTSAAAYTAEGLMLRPANYREWIFVTSGINMSYGPGSGDPAHSMFDNVFVHPAAYKSFLQTGTWPDKTVLVLEIRGAESKGSINKRGHFQTGDVMGVEVHVKDEARFPGKWAFFGFDSDKPARQMPREMDCYSCHEQHAAVDTTFVQFYPTLLEIAKRKNTLSAAYLKESSAEKSH